MTMPMTTSADSAMTDHGFQRALDHIRSISDTEAWKGRCGVGIGMARYARRRNEWRDPELDVPSKYVRCAIRARESITPGHAEAE